MPDVSVVIPTFRRPGGLFRAAQSVLAQINAPAFEIVIIDNDPEGTAKETAQKIADLAPATIPVRYVHEPRAGVANARNRAVDEVSAPLIAFLDDDQSAPEHWLASLTAAHTGHPAAVTFGPVETVLPDGITAHRAYFERFFARELDAPTGLIDHYYGCGNALLDMTRMPDSRPLFDAEMNETGGEDDVLFGQLERAGERFGWASGASVYEHVPAARATLGYTLKRAMAYGQGPCTMARKSVPKRWDKVAFWMLVGAYKALVNGLVYAVQFILRAPGRAASLDRAVRGLGKVFWWVDFHFYGAPALGKSTSSA